MEEETRNPDKAGSQEKVETDEGFTFCPRCGHTVTGDLVNAFCPQCGYRFCPCCND